MILIIAPPRTNSSLVEHVLGNSPSLRHECHEPFFGAGRVDFDVDHAYKNIYESIGGKAFDESTNCSSVVIKEIAQWISIGEEYKNLLKLVTQPVVLAIRNPLLAVESRIRKVLETFQEQADENWRTGMKTKALAQYDYRCLGDVLRSSPAHWVMEHLDFFQCAVQADYLRSQGIPHCILDTTDLRASPTQVLQQLCATLQIEFSPLMLSWAVQSVDCHTTQRTASSTKWYARLRDSTGICPPTEIPPPLSMFPKFIQEYLYEKSIPAYLDLASRKHAHQSFKKELNDLAFSVAVERNNAERLSLLGVMTHSAGEHADIELRYIDPLYAVTNDPALLCNEQFRLRKRAYSRELELATAFRF